MTFGPAAGLEIIEQPAAEKSLQNYQWLPGVRGDLLAKPARTEEARVQFEQAVKLAGNVRERALLLERLQERCRTGAILVITSKKCF